MIVIIAVVMVGTDRRISVMCERDETRTILCDSCDLEVLEDETYYTDGVDTYCDFCMERKAKDALNEDFRKKVDFNAEKASNLYDFIINNAFEEKPYIRACDILGDNINDDELNEDSSQWTDILECVCNKSILSVAL